MKNKLHIFLRSLNEDDFKGSQTSKLIQKKAKKVLNSDLYQDNETILINNEKFDIHNMLLCLIYDAI